MKRRLLTTLVILSLILSIVLVVPAYAADNIIFLTTKSGAELTKTQYDNLKKIYTTEDLAALPSDFINEIKNEPDLVLEDRDEVCIITRTRYDENNQPVETINTEVTEAEAKRVAVMPDTRGSTWQTSSKKLTISVVNAGSRKKVSLINTWLKLPKVRSYDVLAVRITDTSFTIGSNAFSASQKHDNSTINYSYSGDNVRVPGILSHPGIGVSMNIVDSVSSSLSNTMVLTLVNGKDNYKVYGTYQHATSKVTLAQSKDYDIAAGGLGNVLKFSSSVAGKYDGMQGVSANCVWVGEQ